jgi:hypothetical protein
VINTLKILFMAPKKKEIDRISEIKELSKKSLDLLREEYLANPSNPLYTTITSFELILRELTKI